MGKAKDLRSRVSSYFSSSSEIGEKTKQLISKIHNIKIIQTQSEIESFLLEAELIKKHSPFYNIKLTDGKSYPFIRITSKDNYPAVLVSRKEDDKKSLYFGRFPNASSMHSVLRTLRKIFPYQSVINHPKKKCLYNHLGLCPCPPVMSQEELRQYKKNITHIIHFLNGDTKKVIKELEKERDLHSRENEFENASLSQKQIDAIRIITSPTYKPFDYEINPNLEEDLRNNEMNSLKEVLTANGIKISSLKRIECYDISNISGTLATGSMVVFENGAKETSEYRRFRISKEIVGPNDFAMMQEVLKRRFKRIGWKMPDLIIVDGGKGQISSAMKAMTDAGLNIPLVGLAKRLETIITPDFKEILLPRRSDGLKLIMKIRDEAHRFAITYHRKLRSKTING